MKLKSYIDSLVKILLLIISVNGVALASDINISHIYIDKVGIELKTIEKNNLFKEYKKSYINLGLTKNRVFLKFTINPITKDKALILNNPRLEKIELYDNKFNLLDKKGYIYIKQDTLYPYFLIHNNKEKQTYYIKVKNENAGINFSLQLKDKNTFLKEDINKKFIILILMSMLFSFLLYGLMLYIYTKKVSYFFYAIYLIVFLLYQNWYLGFCKLNLPQHLYVIYGELSTAQIALLVITFALFAMNFMNTSRFKIVHKTYKVFITIAIIEILTLPFFNFYNINLMIITGAAFIIYTVFTSMYLYYIKNIKDIKYFVYGYLIASIAYAIIILDELGLSTFTYKIPYIVLLGTTSEALIFLLAFYDSFNKLTKQANEQEILKQELKLQQIYLDDMHHRIKNNLNLISSMIDSNYSSAEEKERNTNLQNRIFAISNIYTMLSSIEQREINMKEYIEMLIQNIKTSFGQKNVKIKINIDKNIVFSDYYATYLGIIINEVLTNSFKYAFSNGKGEIFLKLKKDKNYYELVVKDSGKGFNAKEIEQSYGLRLIKSIVKANLKGEYKIYTINQMKYIIRFKYGDFDS
jgi:two-component sensor histidine kinase